jgi:hypothetical protein
MGSGPSTHMQVENSATTEAHYPPRVGFLVAWNLRGRAYVMGRARAVRV